VSSSSSHIDIPLNPLALHITNAFYCKGNRGRRLNVLPDFAIKLFLLEKSTQRAGAKKADKQIDNRGMLFNIAQSLELEQLGLFISFSSPLAGLFTVLVPP
jgi:hypothetical protein